MAVDESACSWATVAAIPDLTVLAASESEVETAAELESGVKYRFTASGTYSFWTGNANNPQADAEFANTTGLPAVDGGQGEGWHDPGPNREVPVLSNLELLVGEEDIDWLHAGEKQYNPAHVYTHEVVGAGEKVGFKINDNYLPDNDGSLTVKVERCMLADQSKPDLTFASLTLSPTTPQCNLSDYTITPRITNIGQVASADTRFKVTLEFFDGATKVWSEDVAWAGSIPPGSVSSVIIEPFFSLTAGKSYVLKGTIDPGHVLDETTITNNTLEVAVKCAVPSTAGPDLAVKNFIFTALTNDSRGDGSIAFDVVNVGTTVPTAAFTVAILNDALANKVIKEIVFNPELRNECA